MAKYVKNSQKIIIINIKHVKIFINIYIKSVTVILYIIKKFLGHRWELVHKDQLILTSIYYYRNPLHITTGAVAALYTYL